MPVAVLLAAGESSRFKLDKVLSSYKEVPIFILVLKKFLNFLNKEIKKIVFVYRDERQYKKILDISKKHKLLTSSISFVKGGVNRQDSVLNALRFLEKKNRNNLTLIHDVARPFLSINLLKDLISIGRKKGNIVLAKKCISSVKVFTKNNTICRNLNRKELCFTETPQIFPYSDLRYAYEFCSQKNYLATDEAGAIEFWKKNYQIFLKFHKTNNKKLTYLSDL